IAVSDGAVEFLLQLLDRLRVCGQLLLTRLDGLLEVLLPDLSFKGQDVELLLELLVLAGAGVERLGLLGDLLLARGELAAQDVELLLLGGDGLDDLLLADELLLEQLLDGRAVFTFTLLEAGLRLHEAPLKLLELHLDALDLDVLVVQPVLDGEQLASANAP